MSRSNRTGRGRLALPGLELYVTQAQGAVQTTDANRVQTVDNIIDRAILVLESAKGQAVLSQLGRQIVSKLG